jgi:hypothetical protein
MIESGWNRTRTDLREVRHHLPTYREQSGCAKNFLSPFLILDGWVLLSRSTAVSQLGSMCECSRRTGNCIFLILIPKILGRDKAGVHSEYVEN